MGRVTAVSPVPPSLALDLAGGRPFLRKALLYQCASAQAIAFMAGGAPLALAMLQQSRRLRAELAIAFFPAAAAHMRELIAVAQLTLRRMRDARILVFCRIRPGNRAGERMARLAGFRPGGLKDPEIWLWRGKR